MAAEIRICPNCGAGVVGSIETCPRCDYHLSALPPDAAPEEAPTLIEDTYSVEESEKETLWDELKPHVVAATDSHKPAPKFEDALTGAVAPGLIGATAFEDTQKSFSLPPAVPQWQIPPAPYTPPPPIPEYTRSVEGYSYPSNHYLMQRANAYQRAGYRLRSQSPYQIILTYGKPLGFAWWLVALMSGVGVAWYFLIMLTSGFSQDVVYILMERDGTLYEDGAGASHVRRQRARVGRRWGFLGVVIFFISLVWFIGMIIGAVYVIDRYRPELEAAYPTVKLFTSDQPASTNDLDAETIERAESGVLAFSILFVLSALGVLSGLALTIVGYLHSHAYDVRVPPLPEYG